MFSNNKNIKNNIILEKRYVCNIICINLIQIRNAYGIVFRIDKPDNSFFEKCYRYVQICDNGWKTNNMNISSYRYSLDQKHYEFVLDLINDNIGKSIIHKIKENDTWFVSINKDERKLVLESI